MEADSSLDTQTPVVENMVVGVPPVFEGLTKQIDKIVEQPLLGPKTRFPAGETNSANSECASCVDQLDSEICICAQRCIGKSETAGYCPSRVQGQVSREHHGRDEGSG
jgi:hypothetical protein